MNTITCPSCLGGKTEYAVTCGRGASGSFCCTGNVACHLCKGAGSITTEYAARIDAGNRLRHDRVFGPNGPMTAKQAANAFGVDLRLYCDIEHGRAEMPPAVAAHYATLLPTATGGTPNEI